MTFTTEGEKMLGRPLEKEMKAGVPHYKSGQHHASIVGDDCCYHAVLSYVSAMGHAVQILCRKTGEDWTPCPGAVARSAGQGMVFAPQPLPPSFRLSGPSIEALEVAVREERNAGPS
jgi:hypothetical protein